MCNRNYVFLVMNFFSWDFIKTEIDYQKCFNLDYNYLYVYSIHTVPDFLGGRASLLVIKIVQIIPVR